VLDLATAKDRISVPGWFPRVLVNIVAPSPAEQLVKAVLPGDLFEAVHSHQEDVDDR